MKALFIAPLLCACAISAFGQDTATNASPAASTNKATPVATILVSAGEVKAPFVVTNGILSQPEQTDLGPGGKAVYAFTVPSAGMYVFKALVDAPGEDSNSFFLNVDEQPTDPEMVWDIEVTNGFEERTVSWRGNGDPSSDEFTPKRFNLSAGAHKLIIGGREPTQLKSISIYPAS